MNPDIQKKVSGAKLAAAAIVNHPPELD